MKVNNQPVPFKNIIILAVIVLVISSIKPYGGYVAAPVLVLFSFVGLFKFTKYDDLLIRRITLLMFMSAPIALAIYIVTGKGALPLALFAIGTPLLILAWLIYLREPPYLWPTLRLLQKREYAEALKEVNKYIGPNPNDWKAVFYKTSIHLSLSQFVEAEWYSRVLTRLNPKNHLAYKFLGTSLICQSRFKEAKAVYETVLKLRPSRQALFELAYIQYRLGEYDMVAKALTKVIQTKLDFNWNNLFALYYLGKSLEALGQTEKAKEIFGRMMKFSYLLKKPAGESVSPSEDPEIMRRRIEIDEIKRLIDLQEPVSTG